jgi:MscS family membrane protein
VAVGFAAQSTMQNVVSALQIYSTRPFIVGDRVQLKSMSGSTIVAGWSANCLSP